MPEESRVEAKIDRILTKQTEISERLVRVETLVQERTDDTNEVHERLKKLEDKMISFEKHKTQVIGFKDVIVGGIGVIAAVIAAWGVLK